MISRLVNRFPTLTAALLYAIATCLAFGRIFSGMVLLPGTSDQLEGYPPRLFAAEYFKEFGSIPEWSPYLFGGFPFISNTGFGDTFFPTALLRLIFPVDVGMALGMIVFVFLAGVFCFLFLRSLGLSWGPSFIGGAAYMFSGMLLSLVNPGHDGKLFVSAMLPLALMFLYRGTKNSDWRQYLWFGALVGFSLLTPHFQATYYLLMASGFFLFFMVFLSKEKPASEPWWRPFLFFTGALAIGFAVASIQLLPFMEYMPVSARAASAGDWAYATSYSLPPEEILGLFFPGFNSVTADSYFGQNYMKLHSDYMGAVAGLLALASFKLEGRQRMAWFFVFLAIYALLFSLGAHTPFYGIPYTILPYISRTRAPAIILFLASLSVAVFAAFGAEYLLGRIDAAASGAKKAVKDAATGAASWLTQMDRTVLYGFLVLVGFALLGAAGGLKPVAQSIAGDVPQMQAAAERNYDLFVRQIWMTVLLAAGAIALLIPANTRRFGRDVVALYLGAIVLMDLWLLERNYINFSPRATQMFAADEVVAAAKADTTLHRIMPIETGRTYATNYLMAHRVRTALGYNGFEMHAYDQLLGGKNSWGRPWQSTIMSPRIWQLLGVRYVVMTEEFPRADSLPPELKQLEPILRPFWAGLVPTGQALRTYEGGRAQLFRVANPLPFAFLVSQAWKVDAGLDTLLATMLSPQFDPRGLLLVPGNSPAGASSVSAIGAPIQNAVRSTEERPGKMRFEFERPADADAFLYIAENYYLAWKARVDGVDTPVMQAQMSLMAVPVKAGSRLVELDFSLGSYHKGRIVSLVANLGILVIVGATVVQARRRNHAAENHR